MMRSLVLSAAILLLLAACTSDQPSDATIAASTTSANQPASSTSAPSEGTTTTHTESVATTTAAPVEEGAPYIETIVIPGVTLLTPAFGGGERPLLHWEPVEGAAWYQAIVLTSGGETYWTWPTEETEVFVSGIQSNSATSTGPRISPGMAWVVVAFDDADQLMAQSNIRPISP